MKRTLLLVVIAFACIVSGALASMQSVTPSPSRIESLETRVASLEAEVAFHRSTIKHETSPWQQPQHVRWDPKDPTSVTRMKAALGSGFFNHGGLLRVAVNGYGVVEVPADTDVTFQPPKWTVIGTWPDFRDK